MSKRKPALSLDSIETLISTGGRKKPKRNPDRPLEGVADLAAIDRVLDHLEAIKRARVAELRDKALATFIDQGLARGEKPINYYGVEYETVDGEQHKREASIELRKHVYPLTPEQVLDAKALDLPIVERVEAVQTYVINPAYADDRPLMEGVVAALNRVKGVPRDLLLKQVGSSRHYCTDLTIPRIFQLPKRGDIEVALKSFATLAVGKFSYQTSTGMETDIGLAWDRVKDLLEDGA